MAKTDTSTLDLKHLLTAVINLLHRNIIDANRTQAKKIYSSLDAKRVVGLVRLKLESGNLLDTELEMDKSDYVGELKFSLFRNALTAWMANAIDQVKSDKTLPTLVNEHRAETLINIPGAVVSEGQLNVLFVSLFQPAPGRLRIRLIFVDPSQFVVNDTAQEATA